MTIEIKMFEFDFDPVKNSFLKENRNINFSDIICLIGEGYLLDIIEHHNADKYPYQKMFVVDVEGYVYLVPFVQNNNKVFLKTLFPSRKATKEYVKRRNSQL